MTETNLTQKIETPVNETLAKAKNFKCTNLQERISLGEFLKTVKIIQKQVKETFRESIDKAKLAKAKAIESLKAAEALQDKFLNPLEVAESELKSIATSFDIEQERIAREEQERINRIAREEEEKKRKALEARAEKALEKGNEEKADELLQQADDVYVPAPVIQAQTTQIKGQSGYDKWSGECIDLMALVKEIVAGNAPLNLIKADSVAINKLAGATKAPSKINGLIFRSERIMSVRV